MIEVNDGMPFHFSFTYKLETTEALFFFLQGRPGQVMWIDYVSVYNPTANNFTHVYLLCKDRGIVTRCDYKANCNTLVVQKFTADHYLTDHEELGIAITGSAATDTMEVTIHGIRLKNEDYHKRVLG